MFTGYELSGKYTPKSPCITSSPLPYDAHVDIVGVTSDNRSETAD